MRLLMIGAVAAAVLAASASWGYPNFVAATGLVATPNAFTEPSGQLTAAGDLLDTSRVTLNGRAVYGVSSRLEVGALLVAGVNDGLGVSAKYMSSASGDFRWAVGGSLIAANGGSDNSQLYIAATKPFSVPQTTGTTVQATAGLMTVNRDGDNRLRPWLGGQLVVGNTEVVGEYQFRNLNVFNNEVISLAVRQNFPTSRIAAEVGFTQSIGIAPISDSVIFGGVAYRWP